MIVGIVKRPAPVLVLEGVLSLNSEIAILGGDERCEIVVYQPDPIETKFERQIDGQRIFIYVSG